MNKKLRKFIDKFELLKVFSIAIAVILFITVNPVISNPIWNELFESTTTVSSVPINVEYDTEQYFIEGIPSSIDVSISGKEDDVRDISNQSTNLVASLNLSDYTPGTYEVSSDQVGFNLEGATISPTQESFTIIVQEKIQSEIGISLNYINGDELAQGLLLSDYQMTPTSVTLSGGNEDVSSVTTVLALADLTQLEVSSTSGTSKIEVPLVAYDANGNRVSNVELEPSTIELEQDYSVRTVTLPVVYEYTNNSTDLFVSSICPIDNSECDETYQEEVEVFGDSDKINNLSSITYQINLSDVDEAGGTVSGTPILESDIYILDNDTHEYNVTFEEGKTVEIEDVSVSLYNIDDSFTAVSTDPDSATVNVSVTGANSQVEDLTAKDIYVYVDLTEYTQPGTYEVPLSIRRDKNLVYELENEFVSIEIKERDNSTDTESDVNTNE